MIQETKQDQIDMIGELQLGVKCNSQIFDGNLASYLYIILQLPKLSQQILTRKDSAL